MGLILSVMLLPMLLAFSLHWLTKRNEARRRFEMEKETIFSKHATQIGGEIINLKVKEKNATEEKKAA